jgi:hypothetical protein
LQGGRGLCGQSLADGWSGHVGRVADTVLSV